jgi:RES domain-containing protein
VARANETDLVSGEGSRLHGQRWNPRGLFRAVYFSIDIATAQEEFLAQNRRQGLPDAEATPFVTTSAEIELSRVLDLTDGELRKRLRVSRQRMLNEPHAAGLPESITQALGRIAFSEGYQGLLVPSAAHRGHTNLVVFPENLLPGQLRVVSADRLPR